FVRFPGNSILDYPVAQSVTIITEPYEPRLISRKPVMSRLVGYCDVELLKLVAYHLDSIFTF
ncbi:hypothetical protein EWB00_011358, partial [Schistosoma japonicum]